MADRFCILPWIHMHIWPNGSVYPCCVSDSRLPVGDATSATLGDVWNGQEMRDLRLRMLRNEESQHCRRCYELEDSGVQTLRLTSNDKYAHHMAAVGLTAGDGSSPNMTMAYLDIRFSNICNLRCRTCGPDLSSGWYDDAVVMDPGRIGRRIYNVNDDGSVFAQLKPHLHQVESVYFAGGESLLTEEHYMILDHWLEIGHTTPEIGYTTNFTVLDYKKRDIFDLWSRFERVSVAASLDGSHARGEYLRKNMSWDDVVSNRRRMIRSAPRVGFEITPTVSAFNGLHLPDFHREWAEAGLLDVDRIRLNILTWPDHTSLRVLPEVLRDRVRRRIDDHCAWLSSVGASHGTIEQWRSVVRFMDGGDDHHLVGEFMSYHGRLDRLRGEDMLAAFPELEVLNA